jgi:acylphosphatase
MQERLHAIVSGRVQMVMYRDFTYRNAKKLSLRGQVRNLPNGTVEVVAEGSRSDLEKLVEKLKEGPLFAHVTDVAVSWLPITGAFQTFRISFE